MQLRFPAQVIGVCAAQLPAPSQKLFCNWVGEEQVTAHCKLVPGYVHVAVLPSQLPPQIAPWPVHVREPCGAPAATVTQLPRLPGTSHA
jgi:hypothetical protein